MVAKIVKNLFKTVLFVLALIAFSYAIGSPVGVAKVANATKNTACLAFKKTNQILDQMAKPPPYISSDVSNYFFKKVIDFAPYLIGGFLTWAFWGKIPLPTIQFLPQNVN